MRVRIAEAVVSSSAAIQEKSAVAAGTGFDTNFFDHDRLGLEEGKREDERGAEERKLLDRVGEDLARLGRVKRVGLGVREKVEFVKVWTKRRR